MKGRCAEHTGPFFVRARVCGIRYTLSTMSSEYEFPAPVLKKSDQNPAYHYIPIPPEIAEELVEAGTRRIIADLNGTDVRRYLFNNADGEWAIIVGLSKLREAGVHPGDMVIVGLKADPNPDHVEICEEFRVALDQDPEACERFESFTTGKQRSLAHYINSARRTSTRVRRSLELCEKIRTHTLHSDRSN